MSSSGDELDGLLGASGEQSHSSGDELAVPSFALEPASPDDEMLYSYSSFKNSNSPLIDDDIELDEGGVDLAPELSSSAPRGFKLYFFFFLFGLFDFLTSNYLNLGLVAVPFTFLAFFFHWGSIAIFLLSIAALLPLSWQIYWAREQLAMCFERDLGYKNCGAFLETLLGHVPDLLIAESLLWESQAHAVRAMVAGLFLSRLLLSLGLAYLAATQRSHASYSSAVHQFREFPALTTQTILLVLSISLTSICAFSSAGNIARGDEGATRLSRWLVCFLLLAAIAFFVHLYRNFSAIWITSKYRVERSLRVISSGVILLLVVGLTSTQAFFLAKSVADISLRWGLSAPFLGGFVLPIGAFILSDLLFRYFFLSVEGPHCLVVTQSMVHATSIRHAMSGSLPYVIQLSAVQLIVLALLVTPLFVLSSWLFSFVPGKAIPLQLALDFSMLELVGMLLPALLTVLVVVSGATQWIVGAFAILTYFATAVGFFYRS